MIKSIVINYLIEKIKQLSIHNNKIRVIKYGLESIYINLTKIIIILLLSIYLKTFKETIIMLLLFNIIRLPSFGIHATKSILCLLSSIFIFIVIPISVKYLVLSKTTIAFTCSILIFSFLIFAPNDTHKRPIINKYKRNIFKILAVTISVIYFIVIMNIKNNYLINLILFAMIIESFLINPIIYKIFNLSYSNYRNYSKIERSKYE